MKPAKALDLGIALLMAVIALLIVTGGVVYSSATLKVELSQVDAFAFALMAFVLIRKKLTGAALSPKILSAFEAFLASAEKAPRKFLLIAIGAYVPLMTWSQAWRFQSFRANAFDMGYVDQSLWSTLHGSFLYSTLSRGSTYLGEHFSPILALVSGIYGIWDDPNALFFFQSLVLGASAALLYAFSRKTGHSKALSVFFSILFLLYQPLRGANGFDFREDDLFVPIFLAAFWAIETHHWTTLWLLTVAAWCTKENAALFTFFFGLWLCYRNKTPARWNGLVMSVLSIPVFLVVNTKITPYFAGAASETMAVRRLQRLGGSNEEILRFLLTRPFSFLYEAFKPVLSFKALKYASQVLVPFLIFLPSTPILAAVAAIGILMNLSVNLPTLGFHYECLLIPFLFASMVYATSSKKISREKLALVGLSFLLFFGRSPIESIRRHHPNDHHRMAAEALEQIPPQASVATQSAIFPHLAHRKEISLFSGEAKADFIVADFHESIPKYATPDLAKDIGAIDPAVYAKVFDRDGLVIFKRKK